jgi:hypothetical protein
MTELIFKKDIDKRKMKALLSFFKSWGIDAEFKIEKSPKRKAKFSLSSGLWKDYPITGEELRKQAWS